MKTSPVMMGVIYAIMGTMFTFLAIQTGEGNIWNASSILLMLIAAFDFYIAIKVFTRLKK